MKFNIISKVKELSIGQITVILIDVIIVSVLFLSEEPLLYIIGAFFIVEIILVITLGKSTFISFKKPKNGNSSKTEC